MQGHEAEDDVAGPGAEVPAAAVPDWPDILRRYGRLVYSIPRRFGLSPHDCDDVYQSTWLTAVSRAAPPPDRDGEVLVRWLAAIAAWETRNLLRRRRRPAGDASEIDHAEADAEAVPERVEQMVEEHRILEAALAALPPRDRRILRDLFLVERPLTYDEVARRLGVAPGSVGPLRLRAIERLRAELRRRGF